MEKIIDSAETLEFYLTDSTFSVIIRNNLKELLFFEKYSIEINQYDSITLWLNNFFNKNITLISKSWKQVRLGIDTPKYVLIPEKYYNSELTKSYLEQVTIISEKETCFTNVVNETDIRICFTLDNSILELFKKQFKDISIFHSEAIRLNFCLKKVVFSDKSGCIILFINNNRIAYSIIVEKKIKISVSLPFLSFDDILFQTNRLIKLYFSETTLPEIYLFSKDDNLLSELRNYFPESENKISHRNDFSDNIEAKHLYLCE